MSGRAFAEVLEAGLEFRQSKHEGMLVDWIHEARVSADAIVINPAGYPLHSIPIFDALQVAARPMIEVHISNIHARDELHRHSILSSVSTAVISGFGTYGYILAMQAAAPMVGEMPGSQPEPIRVGPV